MTSILKDFYIAAQTCDAWLESRFRKIANDLSFEEVCALNEETVYRILNWCVLSDVNSAQVLWWLKMDFECEHKLTISKYGVDKLRMEMIGEWFDIVQTCTVALQNHFLKQQQRKLKF